MTKPTVPITRSTNKSDDSQFQLELYWCIQQLEAALNSGKLSQKVAEDTSKNLKVLKGKSAPLIKKRQIMRAAMGDYRAKMKEEEKKMALATKQIKFNPTTETAKRCSFVKKSAILTSGKEFKFNFETATQEQENHVMEQAEKIYDNLNTKNIKLTSGSGFKFNFTIDEVNNEFKMNELSIK